MSTVLTSSYKSRDGVHNICYYVWFPEAEPRAVVQIAHGMSEHSLRYAELADFLTARGFVVCANDHLGHGGSVRSEDELGFFAEHDGWECAVKDMHTLTRIVKRSYPSLPFCLFGHSMGSLLARAYTTWFGSQLEGVIYSGTSAPMKLTEPLLTAIAAAKKARGAYYRSETLNKLAFGSHNKRVADPRTESDWLTRDSAKIDAFVADPKCGFVFTLGGFEDLGRLMRFINHERWFSTLRKDLPILLISGDADPVGAYGEGVKKVFNKLISYCCQAHIKLYEGARHELTNELNRQEVFEDVLRFFEMYI